MTLQRPEDELAAYYRLGAVRARIVEYCGGSATTRDSFSAWRLAGYGGLRALRESDEGPVLVTNQDLSSLLGEGSDVCRSLADGRGTLLHIDLDYSNPTDPAEPYLDPAVIFRRLEPVYQAVQDVFDSYGLPVLALMTACGYHFTVRVPFKTPLHDHLVALGRIGETLRSRYERAETVLPNAVARGRAHVGAGKLAEDLAHRVMRRLAGALPVPVDLADVPPPGRGGFVCLDLSAYGDPLDQRTIRCAFSANQKANLKGIAPDRPYVICLPRGPLSLPELLATRADLDLAARAASEVHTPIPDADGGTLDWVNDYKRSNLYLLHEELDRARIAEPAPRRDVGELKLPACAAIPLDLPNPALLKPVYLRIVTHVLGGLGFPPGAIADLVRSRYEEDFGWGDYWSRYDTATRAAFYVGLFWAAREDGLVEERDFTCDTETGRGACPGFECGHELADFFRKAPDLETATR